MAPHSSTLAWKIPWTEEPGGLRSMGSLGVGHDWATSLWLATFMHWRRQWQPTSSVLAWRIPGTGQPAGLPSLGSHRVGHDWSDLAAAALLQFHLSTDSFITQGLILLHEELCCDYMALLILSIFFSQMNLKANGIIAKNKILVEFQKLKNDCFCFWRAEGQSVSGRDKDSLPISNAYHRGPQKCTANHVCLF